MKNFAMISMLCLAIFMLPMFVSSDLGWPVYCPGPDVHRDAACNDTTPEQSCEIVVVEYFSASLMPRCTGCVDVGPNQSNCTTELVCGFTHN
ncbi:hypothetical protein C2S51_036305 [Perilla frutescens var. frutescens]|nr:hypothetical protein C2S51_036305 [Perilla frutescens var. frutescens]